jgi:hypothetical protein
MAVLDVGSVLEVVQNYQLFGGLITGFGTLKGDLYNGANALNAGVFAGNSYGYFSAGPAYGTLTIQGNYYPYASDGTHAPTIGNVTIGLFVDPVTSAITNDMLDVTGTALLAGSLTINHAGAGFPNSTTSTQLLVSQSSVNNAFQAWTIVNTPPGVVNKCNTTRRT